VIWRRIVRPLLPWLGRLVVVVLVALVLGYGVGRVLIARAEPDRETALPAGVPGRLVDVHGRMVHVVEAGDGPTVILVHGFAGSTLDWEEHVLAPLARTHRVVALDLLGMGFSARDDELAYGFGTWTDQVVDTMDALGIARATLVGHSLGGAIVALVAGEHAERVDRLVLVAALVPLQPSERAWFFNLLEIPGVGEPMLGALDHLPHLPGFSAAYHARAHEIFRRRGTRDALLRYQRHGRDIPRLEAAYRQIRAPTLVVHGTADDTVPWAAVRRWAPAIDGALVLPLDGIGHWIPRDAPERLLTALGDVGGG